MAQRPLVAALLDEVELLQAEVANLSRRLDQAEDQVRSLQAEWEDVRRMLSGLGNQQVGTGPGTDVAAPLQEEPGKSAQETAGPGLPRATGRELIDDTEEGPSMTLADWAAFHEAVEQCWVADSGSQTGRVTVTVEFELGRDARVTGEIRLLNHDSESVEAAESAFRVARRAILRCQTQNGFPLPPDKYETWRRVQMTFDPRQMVIQ